MEQKIGMKLFFGDWFDVGATSKVFDMDTREMAKTIARALFRYMGNVKSYEERVKIINENHVKGTPKELVEAARDVNSPLHNEFEWNDGVAAQRYREMQAGYIIRSIELKITYLPTETKRIDLHVTEVGNEVQTANVQFYHALDKDGTGYENIFSICEDEEKTDKLFENCKKDINSFREKYNTLRGTLPKLFEAMDEVMESEVAE